MNELEPERDDSMGTPSGATLPGDPVPGERSPTTDPDEAVASTEETAAEETAAAPGSTSRRGTARWGIALLVTALVVAVAVAGLVFTSTGSSVSRLAGYVPDGTIMYMELRADLPGDQRQNLGSVLAHFPGFDDQANLEGKIDEALDRLVGLASNGEDDYSGEIKPWFGGQVVFAMPELTATPDPSQTRFLSLTSVKDSAAAKRWVAEHLADGGRSRSESYQGVELTVRDAGGLEFAYGVGDTAIFAGDLTSVKAAIDTKGASAFASSKALADAREATPGDRLGFVYVDMERLMEVATSPDLPGAIQLPAELLAQVPPWAAFGFRSESDALVLDMAMPNTFEPGQMPPAKVSTLATRLPAGTIMELEFRSLGQSIENAIEQYKQIPQYSEAVGQVEQALAMFGGVEGLTGWMGDATVVVTRDGETVSGGLVIETADEPAARDRFVQLRNLLTLVGAGSGITIHDEPYGDGQITIIDLGNLADLAALSGQKLPAPAEGRLELAYAIHEGRVIVGVGDGFVKAVLDAAPPSSLADQERYKTTMDRAGKTNTSQMYVDLTGLRELLERLLPADQRAAYELETKPYAQPLAAAAAGGTATDDRVTGRFIVLFK